MVVVRVGEVAGMEFWLDLQNEVGFQYGVRTMDRLRGCLHADILCGMALWL